MCGARNIPHVINLKYVYNVCLTIGAFVSGGWFGQGILTEEEGSVQSTSLL